MLIFNGSNGSCSDVDVDVDAEADVLRTEFLKLASDEGSGMSFTGVSM